MNKYSTFNFVNVKNKNKRLAVIKDIITASGVGSQEELLQLLQERGFELTQATLSRDLKSLKVAKVANGTGEYMYRLLSAEKEDGSLSSPLNSLNMLVSIYFSGNIAVLHTRPGYASGLAYEIDEYGKNIIIGTVAGEDTIIAVIKENITHEEVMKKLIKFIPGLVRK
jgi:transcriptional regulator of arginine metabolism